MEEPYHSLATYPYQGVLTYPYRGVLTTYVATYVVDIATILYEIIKLIVNVVNVSQVEVSKYVVNV